MSKFTGKSPWVVHFNCHSCNGCDIEFLACLTPLYDAERFGIIHVGTPKHADVLVVTGSVNEKNKHVLKKRKKKNKKQKQIGNMCLDYHQTMFKNKKELKKNNF